MPLDLPHILLFAFTVAWGAFVQGTVGFAFVLITTPALLAAGMPLQQTIAIGATCMLVQTGVACVQVRHEIPWREVLLVLGPRLAGLPIGIIVLKFLTASDPTLIKQVVGFAVLLAVAMLALIKPRARQHVPTRFSVAAGGVSGFLAGLTGMGGPPLVLLLALHSWSTRRSRAFLWLSFLIVAPPQLALLAWNFPVETGHGMLYGFAALPIIAAFSYLGVRAGDRLPRVWLRRVMFTVLAAIGVVYAAAPLW